jgi:hypothetical protein
MQEAKLLSCERGIAGTDTGVFMIQNDIKEAEVIYLQVLIVYPETHQRIDKLNKQTFCTLLYVRKEACLSVRMNE